MLFIACGLSQYNIALFHLVNHAFFKALLFLGAGAVIHAMNDEQDLRKLGGLVNIIPFSYTMILIGSLSLMAMPFLTGYYSKDLIIESAYGQYLFSGTCVYWLATISALFTSIYSFRLIYMSFIANPQAPQNYYIKAHEPSYIMGIPLIILAIFSISFGYIGKDLFVGLASPFFDNTLFIHPNHSIMIETEFGIPLFYKILPVVLSVCGSISTIVLFQYYHNLIKPSLNFVYNKPQIMFKKVSYLNNLLITQIIYPLYIFFNQKYWLDLLFNKFIILKGLSFGFITNKFIDRGTVELIGPHGLTHSLYNCSYQITKLDSGLITNYALYMFISLLCFISLLFITNPKFIIIYIISSILTLPRGGVYPWAEPRG